MGAFFLFIILSLIVNVFASYINFVILHNNDIHSRFEETSRSSGTCRNAVSKTETQKSNNGCVGGMARTAHIIRKYRKEAEKGGTPVLYLNAGDTFMGTSWFHVHKAKICVDFLNALKPDAVSLGNHEFDLGVSGLVNFVETAQFPIVAANLNFDQEPSLNKINKSVILEVSGRKIGIVGHLTVETKFTSSPGNVIFYDVIESVKKETEHLKEQGIDIIIILGHSGYEMDKTLAAEVPLADVVIGGHTNTFLWNGLQPDQEKPDDLYPKVILQVSGKKVPVVQAYAYTKYLGVLNVTFDEKGDLVAFRGQPIFLVTEVPQDQDILDKLEVYRPGIVALDQFVVGRSKVLLDATAGKCRIGECNLGNLIADAFVYYMSAQYSGPGWTDTPIALINGGSIRTTIDPTVRGGNITRGDLVGTLPFGNQVFCLTLNGSELLKTLEIGVRNNGNGESSRGEFLQVSGLHVVYDLSKPAFSRVVSAKARCGNCRVPTYQPVVPNSTYRIATSTFLSGGGDDHYILGNAAHKKAQDLSEVDTVVWYLQRHSLVYPEEQGRIFIYESE